jgi:hypothetical protein
MVLLSEVVAQKVKDGEISAELGEAALHKADIGNRIMKIYKHIANSPYSRFTAETLALANIKVVPWNIEGTSDNWKPIFFQQMPLDDFQSYDVPEFAIHELMDPREFCYSAQLGLEECLSDSQHTKKDETLHENTGWERVT